MQKDLIVLMQQNQTNKCHYKIKCHSTKSKGKIQPDVVLLTETHLDNDLPLANLRNFQTAPSRKGGVWRGCCPNVIRHNFVRAFK